MLHIKLSDLATTLKTVRDGKTIIVQDGTAEFTPQEPADIASLYAGGAALVLDGKKGVTLVCEGTPTIKLTAHGSGLALLNCRDCSLSGLTVIGQGYVTEPKYWYFAGVYLAGINTGLDIHNFTIQDFGNHGFGHLLNGCTSNSKFSHNRFLRGGHLNNPTIVGDGAAIAVGGHDNWIAANWIEDWLRGIELETKYPDHDTARNTVERNHLLRTIWHAMICTPTHGLADLFYDNVIQNNVVIGRGAPFSAAWCNEHGIYLGGGRSWTVQGNQIRNLYDWIGIEARADWCDLTDSHFTQNQIDIPVGRTGIHCARNDAGLGFKLARCAISQNIVGPTGGRGVWLEGDACSITANLIHDCGPANRRWEGIYAPNCTGLLLEKNTLFNTAG